jgi:hypothetical protein
MVLRRSALHRAKHCILPLQKWWIS